MSVANNIAYEIPDFYLGILPAGADLSAKQYKAMDVAAGPVIAQCDAAAAMVGILQNAPVMGEAAQLMVEGVSKALLAGVVVEGSILAVDATGGLRVAASGEFGVAKALQAGASGAVVAVLLFGYGKQ